MQGYYSERKGFKLLSVGTEGWMVWWDVHRGKSWGHPVFGLILTAKLGWASLLQSLHNQEGTFWPLSLGERTAAGRSASWGFIHIAHFWDWGSGDEPCSVPQLMVLCLRTQQRAYHAPKAPSDRLCAPTMQYSACDDKTSACFTSEILTVCDSAG